MNEDIKEAMKEKRALFGICECIKNINNIERIFLSNNARQETEERIKKAIENAKSNIKCERLDAVKEDISKRLMLNFSCETISILKGPRISSDRKDIKKEKTMEKKEKKQGK